MRPDLAQFAISLRHLRDIAVQIDSEIHLALADAALRSRHQTTQCALTVILSGFFESFLKDVAHSFINSLCAKSVPFASLPSSIKHTHFTGGGRFLTTEAKKEKRQSKGAGTTTTSEGIAQRLSSVVVGTPYSLVWEAFADIPRNPRLDVLEAYLGGCGVRHPRKTLASAMGMTVESLDLRLDSFMALRNECAHTGTATSVPTPPEIRNNCDFLERIAEQIVNILEARLAAI